MSFGRGAAAVLPAALFVFASAVDAQVPLGPEFAVNAAVAGYQGRPAVAGDASGAFVVAWSSGTFPNVEVFARRFAASGAPAGGEFRVNTVTTGPQMDPSVSMDAAGNFVIVWNGQSDNKSRPYGQRYNSAGTPVGGEFRVDGTSYNAAFSPRVAYDTNGNFEVVWYSYVLNQSSCARFSSSGAPLGSSFLVTPSPAVYPDVAPLRDGGFVVVWNAGDASAYATGRRFDSTGSAVGAEFRVNAVASNGAVFPGVASDGSGAFAAASAMADGTIDARLYDAAGTGAAGDFRVDLDGTYPRTVAAAGGRSGFLVAWSTQKAVGNTDIRARHVPGGEIRVNSYTTGTQRLPAVAALAPGQFVVVWASAGQDTDSYGIFGQRISTRLNGDANGDGALNVTDVFYLINFLFAGGPAPLP